MTMDSPTVVALVSFFVGLFLGWLVWGMDMNEKEDVENG